MKITIHPPSFAVKILWKTGELDGAGSLYNLKEKEVRMPKGYYGMPVLPDQKQEIDAMC